MFVNGLLSLGIGLLINYIFNPGNNHTKKRSYQMEVKRYFSRGMPSEHPEKKPMTPIIFGFCTIGVIFNFIGLFMMGVFIF